MGKIFLSHSSKDKEYVGYIANLLGKDHCTYDEMCFEYGMKNIDKTVKAYGGYCSRTIENGIFSCHIRMQNRADIEPFVPLGERK